MFAFAADSVPGTCRLKFLWCLVFGVWCFSSFAQKQVESSVKTLSPTEGDREARELVPQILAQRPEQTFTNAVLRIRNRDGVERRVAVRFQTAITPTNWSSTYESSPSHSPEDKKPFVRKLTITHAPSAPNRYLIWESSNTNATPKTISPSDTSLPFATSDFSVADLGLEFLHWPKQRVAKKEMYSSRYCAVLDSINPSPAKGACARIRSWITTEPPLAPVRAEAYDAAGKRIKVFDVKGVEKVKGHFKVDSVEMRDLQTGSRTIMEFDLGGE